MSRMILNYVLLFFLLEAVDIFGVSQLDIHRYVQPHVTPLFILLLPVRTSKSLLITLGFFTGLVMDIFLNTGGLFAASTTLIAFLRIFLLPFFTTPEDYDNNHSPNLTHLGTGSFLLYSSVLIFACHLSYFLLEIFEFRILPVILFKTLASAACSMFIIYAVQVFTTRKKTTNARRVR